MTNQSNSKPAGSITTTWITYLYDVWGSKEDGYQVNQKVFYEETTLRIPQTRYNVGTPMEFVAAHPTDRQIKRTFGVNCRISTDGDDMTVYVNRERDGYPIGEMFCTSHKSLSPVRK